MDNKVKWNCISIILRDWSDNKMINRKCSRCKEITGTLHGGKKLRKNFYVKTVCKRNCEWEIELSQVEENKLHIFL